MNFKYAPLSIFLIVAQLVSSVPIIFYETLDEETAINSVVLKLNSSKFWREHKILEEAFYNATGQRANISDIRFKGTLVRNEFQFDGPYLRIAQQLDREAICLIPELERDCPCDGVCQYVVNYKAEAFAHVVSVKIVLLIRDVNDHDPLFVQNGVVVNETVLTIPENAKKSRYQLAVCAQDEDTQYGLRGYRIVGATNYFRLNLLNATSKCPIRIDVVVTFDREILDHYLFSIIALDNDYPPKTATIDVLVKIIDENDNAPMFTNLTYFVQVRENLCDAANHQQLLTVVAHDNDAEENGKISYAFDRIYPEFTIDHSTGTISCARSLNFERRQNYLLRVIAQDNARDRLSATATVHVEIIDVNDSPPQITIYDSNQEEREPSFLQTQENQLQDTVGYVIAYDTDYDNQPNITCFLADDLLSQSFKLLGPEVIQKDTVSYRINLRVKLDREKLGDSILIGITCADNSNYLLPLTLSRNLTIRIEDENDNLPQFDRHKYLAEIRENNAIDEFITQLQYFDADNTISPVQFTVKQLEPAITLSTQTAAIKIDANGRVFAAAQFDREEVSQYKFLVSISDLSSVLVNSNQFAELLIIIDDANDCEPAFDHQELHFYVSKDLRFDDSKLLLGAINVTDCDTGKNGDVKLTMEDEDAKFFIFNGNLLYLRKNISTISNDSYWLKVTATDNGNLPLKSTASVFVHNISAQFLVPIFDKTTYDVNISASAYAGLKITKVGAKAYDETPLSKTKLLYSIAGFSDDVFNCSNVIEINGGGEVQLKIGFRQSNQLQLIKCRIVAQDYRFPTHLAYAQLLLNFGTKALIDSRYSTERKPSVETARNKEEMDSTQLSAFLVSIISACVLIVFSVIAVTFLVIRRRRNSSKRSPPNTYCTPHEIETLTVCKNEIKIAASDSYAEQERTKILENYSCDCETRLTLNCKTTAHSIEFSQTYRDECANSIF